MEDKEVLLFLYDVWNRNVYEVFFHTEYSFRDNLAVLNELLSYRGKPPVRDGCLIYEKNTMRHYDEHRILKDMHLVDGSQFVLL
ncbi:MAG: hypothetical protein IKS37_00675 [Solobacterium sp.]|nr:hypothetical protein [Solobacterium sp.]